LTQKEITLKKTSFHERNTEIQAKEKIVVVSGREPAGRSRSRACGTVGNVKRFPSFPQAKPNERSS